ncbi:MAG TPA: translation initiation factor IF-6 [Candidatus Thermoplasmatota archaeon]|nr:translation initiation factor IF-6 [Candidatus Thermoplasmatota archaeon]
MVRLDLNGSPYVGVFARASDKLAIIPAATPENVVAEMERALGVKTVTLSVGGSNIIGSVVAMNSHGAIVADFVDDTEIAVLEGLGLRVGRVAGKFNAAGNNILVNDAGAYVNPDFSKQAEKSVSEILGVPVERGTLAGLKTVGSAACVTSKGVLCHPKTTDDELDLLEKLFKVEADIGTVNHGAPFLGAGIVANRNGAIAGSVTTGPELNRIENALDLI